MAKDFWGWAKWSPHLGNAITIATGFPVVISALAGLWAYLSGRGLSVALVTLAVFMMSLWCCIGFLWLRDRANSQGGSPNLDCSWSLRVDAALLNRDSSNPDLEWQVSIQLRNVLAWPIKIDTIHTHVEIENIVPGTTIDYKVPAVLTAGAVVSQNLPAYRRGGLPDRDRYKGRIELVIRYGHPDYGYSRIMTRKFTFEQIVKPFRPEGAPEFLFPISATVPLPIGSYEEDRDEPYSEAHDERVRRSKTYARARGWSAEGANLAPVAPRSQRGGGADRVAERLLWSVRRQFAPRFKSQLTGDDTPASSGSNVVTLPFARTR